VGIREYIHERHNVSVLLYHLVCPAKYRRVVFTDEVDRELREEEFCWSHFWAKGYYESTVVLGEEVIRDYIKKQANEDQCYDQA